MNKTVDIRTDFPPDDEAISRLHGAAFGAESARVAPWTERLQRHSLTWVGAFRDDDLIAFVHVVWDGAAHGFLVDTVVHPSHQRRGIGQAVVAAAAQRATVVGCEWLHVDFEPHLGTFYRDACGFGSTEAGLMRLR